MLQKYVKIYLLPNNKYTNLFLLFFIYNQCDFFYFAMIINKIDVNNKYLLKYLNVN